MIERGHCCTLFNHLFVLFQEFFSLEFVSKCVKCQPPSGLRSCNYLLEGFQSFIAPEGSTSPIPSGNDGAAMLCLTYTKCGECFVEVQSEEDVKRALEKHKQNLGYRYVEVFQSNRSEMNWMIKRCGMDAATAAEDNCVRLRGLPFGSTTDDIVEFFKGLDIVWNGITFATDNTGRATGEAYVQFSNKETVEKALKKHKEKMGHRYIEIFRSSLQELAAQSNLGPKRKAFGGPNVRPGPYDRGDRGFGGGGPNRFGGGGGGGPFSRPPPGARGGNYRDEWEYDRPGPGGYEDEPGYYVRMRGLPYQSTEQDVADFFVPSSVVPNAIEILYDKGRASGEAMVSFLTMAEAMRAMTRDKKMMGSRYIELFLETGPDDNGPPPMPPRGGQRGGFGNGAAARGNTGGGFRGNAGNAGPEMWSRRGLGGGY